MPNTTLHEIDDIFISVDEIADPTAFFSTDRGKAWFKDQMRTNYFCAYYLDRGNGLDRKVANKLAYDLLEAKYGDGDTYSVLEGVFGPGSWAEDDYEDSGMESEHRKTIESFAEEIASYAADNELELPALDVDLWCETLRELAIDHMRENDDSSIEDMIADHEQAEIVIRFRPDGGDDLIYSNKAWADWHDLTISQTFQRTLAGLGYTIADYRRASENKNKSSGKNARAKRRANPLGSMEDLKAIVDEACSSYFSIVLYAVVSIKDLLNLDPTRPFMMSQYALASYNEFSGTFFDVIKNEAITVFP